jgi:tetratricopeptide (TPR) repeat protein
MSQFDEKQLSKEESPELKVVDDISLRQEEPLLLTGSGGKCERGIEATRGIKERTAKSNSAKPAAGGVAADKENGKEWKKPLSILLLCLFLPWLCCSMISESQWSGVERLRLNNFVSRANKEHKFEEAERYSFMAIKHLEKVAEEDPTRADRLAWSYQRLAETYELWEKDALAAQYLQKAADTATTNVVKAWYLYRAADAYQAIDPALAESDLKARWQLFAGDEKRLDDVPVSNYRSWNEQLLSHILTTAGKFSQAEAAAKRASDLTTEQSPGWYHSVSTLLRADALYGMGNRDGAAAAYKEATNMAQGDDSPEYVNEFFGMARYNELNSLYAAAESALRRALRDIEKPGTEPFYNKQALQNELGLVYIAQQRYAEALTVLNEAITRDRKINDGKNLYLARDLVSLSKALAAVGQTASAQKAVAEALSIRRQILGPDNPLTKEAQALLQ